VLAPTQYIRVARINGAETCVITVLLWEVAPTERIAKIECAFAGICANNRCVFAAFGVERTVGAGLGCAHVVVIAIIRAKASSSTRAKAFTVGARVAWNIYASCNNE